MTESVFSSDYRLFREHLIAKRRSCSLTQAQVAERLKKPQSFVSKYESGERRLDLIEFLRICEAFECDPVTQLTEILKIIRSQ